MSARRWHLLCALLAFGVPLWAYARTVTPTVPFWDSGEFIATSYILGLPHPPGNPVYTMLGRVMTFLPFESIAWRVNFMSSIASALAALFTFLVTARALRRWFPGGPQTVAQWLACEIGGLAAAFFVAFSNSFWDSAVEAEVYSLSSFLIMFTIWLAFNWWDRIGKPGNDLLLVLIVYLLSVSTGVHLGTVLVAPGLLLLFVVVRPSYFTDGRFWQSALLLGTFLLFLAWSEFSEGLNPPVGLILLLIAALLVFYWIYRGRLVRNNLFTWWTLALLVGFTVQLFLLVRSQQLPGINEGAPQTLETWKDYLLRKQYGPSSPFVRRADLWYQINHMYLRYVGEQFQLVGRLGPFGPTSFWVVAVNAIPYLFLLWGAWWNYRRDRMTFWFFLAQNLVMGPGLIFYLNFTDREVRERDYFFTNSYHFMAIWMGMGVAGAFQRAVRALAPAGVPQAAPRPLAAAASGVGAEEAPVPAALSPLPASGTLRAGVAMAGLVLLGLSLLPMRHGWFSHDRSEFYIAHDYAYNMLVPLEPNAVVFTNGDNDTFPLWYIQQVEGVRKDVRVVNLSLLNTPWYIRQLRDEEPKVPISFTDRELDAMSPYLDDRTGKVVWVKDQAVANIVAVNKWRQPLYLAVTVPDQMDLEKKLSLEGLVFRVTEREVGPREVNVERTIDNLYRVFRYQGLLDKNRSYDASVYKDDNAYKLVQNYSAAHVQVAYHLAERGRLAESINLLRDAVKLSPDFPGLLEFLGKLYEDSGDAMAAVRVYEEGASRFPTAPEFHFHLGTIHYQLGQVEQGIAELRRATALNQQYFDWFGALFSALWLEGRLEEALDVLRTWNRAHPEDAQGAAYLRRYEDSLRILRSAPKPSPTPPSPRRRG